MIVRNLRGWRRDRPDHRDKLLAPSGAPLPARVDRRPQCPPVGDQNTIGSCAAAAGCKAMAFLQHNGNLDTPYSWLFLYFYVRQMEGSSPEDDSGCEIRDIMKTLATVGVCTDATWPYGDPSARYMLRPSDEASIEAGKYKAQFYYRCPSLHAIRASIAQGFPVEFGFRVPRNMMSVACAASGIVRLPTADDDGFDDRHAVLAVGYDDGFSIDGQQGAVLCQNSWGTDWGLSGFFWLPYRFFTLKLASDAWTIRRAAV